MAHYKVSITDAAVSQGLGPVYVDADSPAAALEAVAAAEGRTLADLAASGLTLQVAEEV